MLSMHNPKSFNCFDQNIFFILHWPPQHKQEIFDIALVWMRWNGFLTLTVTIYSSHQCWQNA